MTWMELMKEMKRAFKRIMEQLESYSSKMYLSNIYYKSAISKTTKEYKVTIRSVKR